MVSLIQSPIVPQRIRYTILDLAAACDLKTITNLTVQSEGIDEFSSAFHGLLLRRSLECGISHPMLATLARKYLRDAESEDVVQNKALAYASMWTVKNDYKIFARSLFLPGFSEPWRDFARLFLSSKGNHEKNVKSLVKLVHSDYKKSHWQKLLQEWPVLWLRQEITEGDALAFLTFALKHHNDFLLKDLWPLFCGFEISYIEKFVQAQKGEEELQAIKLFYPFLSAELKHKLYPVSKIPQVAQAEERAIKEGFPASFAPWEYPENIDDPDRKAFFDLAYRKQKPKLRAKDPNNFWSMLAHNWQTPNKADLDHLAQLARKAPYLMRIPFILTLGRFLASDEAALKTLDYIRSEDHLQIGAVIEALAGIGTQRSLQELISAITRPNVKPGLAFRICQLLRDLDLSPLERELRSALSDISLRAKTEPDLNEVKDGLSDIVSIIDHKTAEIKASMIKIADLDAREIDRDLSLKIAEFSHLSTEIKRALRTAYFFDTRLKEVDTHAIDISPVLDMQYKALELLFRESFEDFTNIIIQEGILQRKLDVIGYARPIPQAMDQFENYLASLEIIRSIPFFSKFKLRKLLRSICLFRPGKRFTLDGLKAFGLFFLCFGRAQCTYGLSGIAKIGFASDEQLFQFCKDLHVFQDLRNRAAHEGFRPEARSDIQGIWILTAKIIHDTYEIREFIKSSAKLKS